jgi:predicted ATPase/DNA-binding winged helix-turn-helix (wHTH) protein
MPTPPEPAAPLPASVCFGHFELRPREGRLLDGGVPVPLGGRAFDLLIALVERAGELVSRNELIERVWPGRIVEENNLSVQVNAVRKAIGGEWLKTVPGRGYRLAIEPLAAPAAPVAPVADAALPGPDAVATAAGTSSSPHPSLIQQPVLIGRGEELAALATLIDQHRLVTVCGAGGIGKTRLAQTLLHLRAGAYAHGVAWVELGHLGDPAALPAAVAVALGLRPAPGEPLAALAHAAAPLRMLVALDNAEHLVDGVAALASALLRAAPGLHLLVTTQVPLRLAAERVMRLAPLAVPQGPLPAHEAQAFGAVALFVERAMAADSRYRMADEQAPAVIELCRRLDGLPLAIELAAARAPVLGVAGLLAALDDRLHGMRALGSNRDREAPSRQQTLRAALQWSHGLLAPREQALFRRLGVLAGAAALSLLRACTVDEAGSPEGLDEWGVVDSLDVLVQHSLVDVQPDAAGAEPRYRLLESARALALELLAASDEWPRLRERHAHAVLAELQRSDAALWGGAIGVSAWQQQADALLSQAREALAWARDAGADDLALALATVMLIRLPAPLHDERLQLADACESGLRNSADARARQRAWAAISTALGNVRPQRSREAARQALALARAQHAEGNDADGATLYHALCEAADVVTDAADADAAEPLLGEARALVRPNWPPVRLRAIVRLEASVAAARGHVDDSLRLYRRLLDLSRAAGDPSLMTQANLIDVLLAAGQPEAAADAGRALVARLDGARDEGHMAYARINLVAALLALQRCDEAREQLRHAWPTAVRVERQAWCADYLASLAALEGRPEAAAQLVGAADRRYDDAADTRQANEAAARTHAWEMAESALGADEARRLHAVGRGVDDDSVAALAFGPATVRGQDSSAGVN